MRPSNLVHAAAALALAALLSSGSCVVAFRSGCGSCDCEPGCDCPGACDPDCDCACGLCAGATFGPEGSSHGNAAGVPVLVFERARGASQPARAARGRILFPAAGEGAPRLLLDRPVELGPRR